MSALRAKARAFAFDIDGVLLRGGRTLAGARPALELLNSQRVPWVVLTNGGGATEKQRVEKLSDQLGVQVDEHQFLQSHTPFQKLTSQFSRIMVVGGHEDSCRTVAESYGFKDVVIPGDVAKSSPSVFPYHTLTAEMAGARELSNPETPLDAVMVFHDPRDATADLQVLMDVLLSEKGVIGTRSQTWTSKPAVPLYFSNYDLEWAAAYSQNRLGQGAFIESVKAIYKAITNHDLDFEVIGKPSKLTYEFTDELLRNWIKNSDAPSIKSANEICMVGDNQASDIKGANDFGWSSVLVRSGVYKDGDKIWTKPTLIEDDVLKAVEKALE